jgi:sugar phosphate isomerase/epimerase
VSPATIADRSALFSACLPGWDGERVIAAATALGCDAVEWGAGPDQALSTPGDAARLAELSHQAGLEIAGLSIQDPAITLVTGRVAASQVRLAVALGAPQMRLFAARYRGGGVAALHRRHRAAVDRLVDVAAPHGVKVLVETSPDTLAPTPQLALDLVSHHPPRRAGVLYDPGNMVIEGHVKPALAVALLGRHIGHVHVKNVSWSRSAGRWQWKYAHLTTGLLDWTEILDLLAASGYEGRYSIDHLPGRETMGLLQRETTVMRELVQAAHGQRR